MGEGTKQMFTGDVSGGFNKLTQGAGDLFMPSGPNDQQILDLKKSYQMQDPTLSSADALKMAQNQGPGMLRTYGPAAAAGLGIMAMAGGFEQPGQEGGGGGPQFRGPTGEDLLKQNPNKYLVQGLPGVQYDAQGNIIGNKEQYPYYGMQDIQVGSRFTGAPTYFSEGGEVEEPEYLAVGGMPGMSPNVIQNLTNFYMRFRGKPMPGFPRTPEIGVPNIGQSGITMGGLAGVAAKMKAQRDAQAAAAAQAAATAAANAPGQANKLYAANPEQYRPNMTRPDAGIAGLAMGGYPRKTGQISGPGTETSDSIPAMLSDGEFVMTAKAVRGLGQGSRREGAKKMYALMHQLERNAARG